MIKSKKNRKIIAIFLTLNFLSTIVSGNGIYANNNGPNAPEASAFEPVSATDMVNLSSGDMAYVLPLLELNQFPVALSYHSGIPLDMESSWVGLGWNLNTGAITRGMSGVPDDWKNGKSLDFIYFSKSEEFYSINVGVGFGEAAEVGVGLSWGSNKSLSGSVYASLGFTSASVSTDGTISAGVGLGKDGSKYGGGLSVTRTADGKYSGGVGVGTRQGNTTASLGVSFSDGGTAFSISGGYSNRTGTGKDISGDSNSGGLSLGNFSAGDYDISSKGFFVPIGIGIFSFGFGWQKVTYSLDVGYPKNAYGILYSQDAYNPENSNPDNQFVDYQKRYTYTDVYSQVLPTPEEEFIGDSKSEREKINFSFASYDSFEVNAAGVSGTLQPKVLQNATLFGLGYKGADSDGGNGKMRVYYHNSNGNEVNDSYLSSKQFGNSNYLNDNMYFYFNGQFTENATINPLTLKTSFNSRENDLNDFVSGGRTTILNRKRSGNYVEVFTNLQLDNSNTGVMTPENLYDENASNKRKNRVAEGFNPDGIGAYKITAPDGKVYHFSLPVYHYEQVERKLLENNSEDFVNEKRQYTSYATHWLLTAITGPDYVDTNSNNFPDEGDYGYWTRLDHGKWSDGYVWRSPFKGKNYQTNLKSKIEQDDFGNYQFGRKQLYYLDKIVFETHTAYFVKDIRYDATGAYDHYNADAGISENQTRYTYRFDRNTVADEVNGGTIYTGENFYYKREYQLRLDKILLIKNENAISSKEVNPALNLNSQNLPGYSKNDSLTPAYRYNYSHGFHQVYGGKSQDLHMEKNVYDINDFSNFDTSKILKTIQFNYDYNLATKNPNNSAYSGTPSSIQNSVNPNKGKLSLNSVTFKGKNDFSYMPPYQFDYIGNDVGQSSHIPYPIEAVTQKTNNSYIQLLKAKDDWGFYKGNETAWSLNKITTPTGADILFEYEEDDYYKEAFARRYFNEGFDFVFTYYNGQDAIKYTVKPGYDHGNNFKLTDYFDVNENAFIDFYLVRHSNPFIGGDRVSKLGFKAKAQILNLTDTQIIFKVPDIPGNDPNLLPNSCNIRDDVHPLLNSLQIENKFSAKCTRPTTPNGQVRYGTNYKFLANKIPQDLIGGGLRVKNITLEDENNNKYVTDYFYNQPNTSEVKGSIGYKSSGITSFTPGEGLRFVPYQSELPSPGVMYEYVTVESRELQTGTNKSMGKTRYRFHVLRPVEDIFDPNISMQDDQGRDIFNANVTEHKASGSEYYDPSTKLYAKSISLGINTSLIGQFRSVEEFNSVGQLLRKSEKEYLTGESAKNVAGRGTIKESFQTLKSIFKTNSDDNYPILSKRLLSVSTKEDFTSILNKTKLTVNGQTITEEFSDADPQTGAFRTTISTKADGTKIKTTKYPAYQMYPQMGSKVTNVANKHMLTQEAMTVSSVQVGTSSWRTTRATVTTWNNDWQYRNEDGTEPNKSLEVPVWRKHQNYVYRDNVDPSGTYGTFISPSSFNWGLGATQTNTKWQNISEITLYTHYSTPIETRDINNNYMASKMADNWNKTIASGNARYTEMYYSGVEYPVMSGSNITKTEDEFTFTGSEVATVAHTGTKAVKLSSTAKAFRITTDIGTGHDDTSKKLRPGKYKVSYWRYVPYGYDVEINPAPYYPTGNVKLKVNGVNQTLVNTERAGNWVLNNYIIDVNGSSVDIYLDGNGTQNNVIDDFRIHPVYASMNSYVYDQDTDELRYILDGNNLATEYRYDNAGRLCRVYKEVVNTNGLLSGFKLISQNNYHYKDSTGNNNCGNCCDNNQ